MSRTFFVRLSRAQRDALVGAAEALQAGEEDEGDATGIRFEDLAGAVHQLHHPAGEVRDLVRAACAAAVTLDVESRNYEDMNEAGDMISQPNARMLQTEARRLRRAAAKVGTSSAGENLASRAD